MDWRLWLTCCSGVIYCIIKQLKLTACVVIMLCVFDGGQLGAVQWPLTKGKHKSELARRYC